MPERLTYARGIYGEEEKQAVRRSLDSGWLSGGVETGEFEHEFARWWGVKHSLAVNSGSSADLVALQALNLPRGSEVITNAGAAFPTTVSAMTYLGLEPVFVDVKGLTIDPDEIKKAIGPKTKAVMFAHTLGFMPDMTEVMDIVNNNGLKLVEDCCDSVGSRQLGRLSGTYGNIATVSFYPAHHMTTGEGGMVLTNDSNLYREAYAVRNWGADCTCGLNGGCATRFSNPPFDHRYYYTRIGGNFQITEMQAAFGREQLKRLDGFIETRRRNYNILANELGQSECGEISPFAYPLFSKNKLEDMAYLNNKGIDTRVMFGGNIVRHPAFKGVGRVVGDLPESDRILNEGYFVGVGPHLSPDNMLYIAKEIKCLR
ncbi:MAG: 3-amino-5-hydroxybenzoate synthase [bacterium ADurb.Bin212]|nr:MAG: 3-amino-5-hydroxybenzoate synthase [bacterium ADurb.Bin212]